MSILEKADITQCMNFYLIKDDQTSSEVGPDKDFFVGSNRDVTLKIPNGQAIQVRDVVVLGKLTINSTFIDKSYEKGSFIANNIFAPGNFEKNYVNVKCKNIHKAKNVPQFKEELRDIIIKWFRSETESAEKIILNPW